MARRSRPPAPLTRPTVNALTPHDIAPGRDVTIGDFIVEQVRAGVDLNYAAGVAGVTNQEVMAWMREGSLVFARLNAGARWTHDFTAEQQDCAVFADKAIRAVSSHIARLALTAEQIARGTLTKEETRTKRDAAGRLLETTTVTAKVLPDPSMIMWKLERLAASVYGPKATLNISVQDLSDTDDEADALADKMLALGAALAIEATATD